MGRRGVKHEPEALRVLEYYWAGPPPVRHPDKAMLLKIAGEISTDFTTRQVSVWFSNTRQGLKRQARQAAQVAAPMPAQVAGPLGTQQVMLMPVVVQHAGPMAAHTPQELFTAYPPPPGWMPVVVQRATPLPLLPFTPSPSMGPVSFTPFTAYPPTPTMAALSHTPWPVMAPLSLPQLTPSTLSPEDSEQHPETSAGLFCDEVLDLFDSDDVIGDLLGETPPSAGRQTHARPTCVRVGNQSQGWRGRI